MKRIFAFTFIIMLLAVTSLFALRGNVRGRNYNRDLQKRSGNPNWARCIGKDSDGAIRSQASIEVDVDKPWEGQYWGVDYQAYGGAWGWANDGEYTIYASVPNDTDGEHSGTADGHFSVSANAQDFDWWADVNAEEALSSCSGSGSAYSQNNLGVVDHRSRSEAFKFARKGES